VQNYNGAKPKNFNKIVEIAFSGEPAQKLRPLYHDLVVAWTGQNFAGCDVKVSIECPKCHEHQCSCGDDSVRIKVNDDWLSANADRRYWNLPWYRGSAGLDKPMPPSFYGSGFHLIRPKTSPWFGAQYHVRGCPNLDNKLMSNCPVQYVFENKSIRINAETGTILLSYLQNQTDEKGWPLIPNDPDLFEALFWDVEYKILYRQKRKHKDNYQLAMNAKRMGEDHMARAKSKLESMSPLEWNQMIANYFKTVRYRNKGFITR